MKSILCIIVSVWISSTLARFDPPQSILKNEDFEIKVGSGPFDLKKDAVADHAASSKFSEDIQGTPILVDFDDIELAVPFAPISKYSNFTLSGFSLMNVPLAYKNGSLAAEDIVCATSPPNALKGSRSNPSVWPRIAVSAGFPGTHSTSGAKSFKLLGMSIKALGVVPKYLSIIFQGWVIENGRAIDAAYLSLTYLTEGHQGVLRINFSDWASWQKNITVVEVWAQTLEREDWEFCVDDVLINFVEGVKGGTY